MAELQRTLGFWTILALAIGSIAGTGLFFGSAIGARYAGNASLIAWALLAVVSLYIAACFGELVAMFPKAGGVYEYSKHTYGRFFSFLVGWIAWLTINITTTLLIVAAVDYLTPAQFPVIFKILISVGFILLLNVIAYIGLEASSVTLITFAVITVALVAFIVIPGMFHINPSNFSPLLDHSWPLVFLTLFFIVETYFGWESATYLAEETKNPEKVIPKALMIGTIIVAVMSLGIVIVSLGMIPAETLAQSTAPLNTIANILFGSFGVYIVGIGVYLCLVGSAAGGIIAGPRLLMAMARDKMFLAQFSAVHEKFKTPYKAIIFQVIVSLLILFLGFGKYTTLLAILVPLSLFMYIAAVLSVTILRIKNPELKRPFRVIAGKIGPIIVSLLFIAVIAIWIAVESRINLFLLGLSILALGIPLYFLIEMYYDPGMIKRVNSAFARLALWTENIYFPKKLRQEMIARLGGLKGKKVLEFGCNVGTFTIDLAKSVGPEGAVYATSVSGREVDITRKRVERRGYGCVNVLKQNSHSEFNKSIKNIDVVTSVGVLGYVIELKSSLKEIHKRLKKNGRFCFLEYDRFFWFIPNASWLSDDEKIKSEFSKAGLKVEIVRKQGLFWQYIYMYGRKK